MSRETDFIEKAKNIIYNACKESIAKVKEGSTIIIDDSFKFNHGDFHKWRSGDEFRVVHIKRTEYMTVLYCVATKAPDDGGHSARGKVDDEVEFNSTMLVFEYLRIKGDVSAVNKFRQLCRDYLNGML